MKPSAHPVPTPREMPEVYRAVEALRSRGMFIHRNGERHVVDGKTIKTSDLLRLAKSL